MADRILTTHVGSLPRSQQVVDFLFAKENKQDYDLAAFDHCMSAAVAEVVEKQKQAGVDLVSDGETSKISYSTYVKDRYSGFGGDTKRAAPADLKQYPSYLERLAKAGGTPKYARPQCIDEITITDDQSLHKDIANLRAAAKQHGINQAFMNAASPGVIALFLPNAYYPSYEKYLEVLAEAMRYEYEAIVQAGLQLQLDCPDLALSRHMLFADKSDAEFIEIAEQNLHALNHALQNVPAEQCRLHICWGNYEGPHTCDIAMDKVFPLLMKAKAKYLLFETSNPRHAHEHAVFQHHKNDIPDDKVLVPGVLDTTTNFVEHPQLVAQRIIQFTDIVGRDRVIAGTDCGFGTFAGFGPIDPEICYAKLSAMSEGAQIASKQLWP